MTKKNVVVVEGKDNKGNDVKVIVKRPTPAQMTEGQIVASKEFNSAVRDGAIYRKGLLKSMTEQGLWSDEQQKRLEELGRKINAGERQLRAGGRTPDGKRFTKKQGRDLALNMGIWRAEQLMMLAETRTNDEYTVEGRSDNAKHAYFMSVCVLNEDESPHFESVEDYLVKNNEEHPYVFEANSELAALTSNYDPDYEKNLIENKFLREYGFAREDGRLINEDGDLVDSEGRRINEDGRYIDEDGNFVDIDGNRVDEEGNPVEEFVPFAEDDEEESEEVELVTSE